MWLKIAEVCSSPINHDIYLPLAKCCHCHEISICSSPINHDMYLPLAKCCVILFRNKDIRIVFVRINACINI